MKPREQGGVVDERLNVYGVHNLKIAGNCILSSLQRLDTVTYLNPSFSDCSIAPGNVGANTYNTAIAIGEKAAVVIAEDLGIKGVTSE
jgi:alcohol oxidase